MTMWKAVLAGTTAIAIVGSTLAYAQGPSKRDRADHWRPSAQDMAAFGDARIAALKAGLKLTPDQEKNWPALETAMRDQAKERSERFAARASADKPAERSADPIERLNRRAEMMTERGATLKKLADAAGPLYSSLDEGQKKRFVVLAKLGAKHAGWRGKHRGHGHGPAHHRGGPRGERGGPNGPQMGPDDAPRPQ